MTRLSAEGGYTLTELLVSMAIMLVVTGSIFQLVNPSQSTSQTQPEVQDMQQRVRVGSDMLFKDLVMAGAGPYQGPLTGALTQYFAPILPRKVGYSSPDAYNTAYPDRITITYVPNTYSQTTIASPMPQPSQEIKVDFANGQAGCPYNPPTDCSCGMQLNDSVLIFDTSGHFDTFTITNVQAENCGGNTTGLLQHRGQDLSYAYGTDAMIMKVNSYSYYLDHTTNQLMRYDGGTDTPTPVIDNVVDLKFEYYGDPNLADLPKPPVGKTSCLYPDGSNLVSGLYSPPQSDGSLAPFPLSAFTDGPYCGGGSNEFDADLYRVRKVRMTVRVQTPVNALRGQDTNLFKFPGTGRNGQRLVPDLSASFEITPRNMNLSR
jgi:prepilin-type N-terminal cleavage/methylation domain-containing protein